MGCTRIDGGPIRQDSVLRLVRAADRPWLLTWDAARPFGSVQLALAVLEAARETGAAGAFIANEFPVVGRRRLVEAVNPRRPNWFL